jgi:hypothetical protein
MNELELSLSSSAYSEAAQPGNNAGIAVAQSASTRRMRVACSECHGRLVKFRHQHIQMRIAAHGDRVAWPHE